MILTGPNNFGDDMGRRHLFKTGLVKAKVKLAVVGLGYVGLPVAIEFAKHVPVIGFDVNSYRVDELRNGFDRTNEIAQEELSKITEIKFTHDPYELEDCNFYIVTVPTPVDEFNTPDLTILRNAAQVVGAVLTHGDVVIFESTVYPGATEEVCVPILEATSGLRVAKPNDGPNAPKNFFYVGYSPERTNPGDKLHRLHNVKKIVSGCTDEVTSLIADLYSLIVKAGVHIAPSIKVAEAAKLVENTQRDVNISLINEMAIIFNLMDIDTEEVLLAAETKWNFAAFRPGLVGGHCIGVDPYYLTHKATSLGHKPEIILSGRRLNDNMSNYVAERVVRLLVKKDISVKGARILIMGITFKENCPDTRNSKIFNMQEALRNFGAIVETYDPWVSAQAQSDSEPQSTLVTEPKNRAYDGVIIAVKHQKFLDMGIKKIKRFCKPNAVIFDVKYCFDSDEVDERL